MSVSLPTAEDQLRWICNTSIDDGKQAIKSLLRDRSKHSDAALHEIFSQAMAYEIHNQHRKSLIVAIRSALKQAAPPAASSSSLLSSVSKSSVSPSSVLDCAASALAKLRAVVIKHEDTFQLLTLGPRLQIGLQCLKAHAAFAVKDPKKHNKSGKNQHSGGSVTRDGTSPAGFEGWLAVEVQWLRKPTAYKYMTAVRGLGLDHAASEKQVAFALKSLLRKGPVTIAALCAAALDACGPPAPAPRLEQTEFEFLRDSLVAYREQSEAVLALKDQLEASPDMYRAACARAYSTLSALTGTQWAPSDEPDALASVNPDAITL
jgi:hypothetical protein